MQTQDNTIDIHNGGHEPLERMWEIPKVTSETGVKRPTLLRAIRAGDLRACKIGKSWRIKPSDLRAWLASKYDTSQQQAA